MNWIMAEQSVFEEYGIAISTERQLSNNKYIKHFELSDTMMVTGHLDIRLTLFTNEAMLAYLEYVEGNGMEA